jgi:putative phage-type endonuclease
MTTTSPPPPAPPPDLDVFEQAWKPAGEQILAAGADHDLWLATRRTGIGASDVAGVLGLSPWTTPLRVYLDKRGLVGELDLTEEMEWGHRNEESVAQKWSDVHGIEVRTTGTWRSRQWPWLLANPDRVLANGEGLECKTADKSYLDDWIDEPPLHYVVQCVACMAVTGARRWHLAALVGGNRYFDFVIERDENDIATVVNRTRTFWEQHFLAEVPPPVQPTAGEREEKLLALLYPKPDGQHIQLTPDQQRLVAEHKDAITQRGVWDRRAIELSAQIKEFLGPKRAGYLGTREVITWNDTKAGRRLNNKWKEQD